MSTQWARRAVAFAPLLCALACEASEPLATPSPGTGGARATGGSAGAGGSAAAGTGGVGGKPAPVPGNAGTGAATGGVTNPGLGGSATGGSVSGGGGIAGTGGATAPGGSGGTTGVAGAGAGGGGASGKPVSFTIFDEVVFYDAYADVVNEPVPAGVLRLRNDLFTHKLTEQELGSIQSTLTVRVIIGALCDNYDRIGSVALALVPKGQSTYEAEDVERVEIGRYITPFMNRNNQPDEVPYEFSADNLVPVLRDAELRAEFEPWLELELFGVPYAANDEVAGCANRNDVFRGSVIFDSDSSAPAAAFDGLIPLAYKAPFNNYQQGASDRSGTTRKTIPFTLEDAARDTQLVLITSNHGANTDGEEYVRRDHFVYVDDEQVLEYKPGRSSCEPFRKFNTQANGIYGQSPRTDSTWQSFSNWCPGDVIDTRIIPLGPQTAGPHEVVIDVPDAEFVGGDGNFPLSLYVQTRSM
jgi:hypothetical protein